MAARVIDGPEKDWLRLSEIIDRTGIPKTTLYKLIKEKKFPPARSLTGGIKRWHWEDYVYWTLHVKIFGMPDEGDEDKDDLHE